MKVQRASFLTVLLIAASLWSLTNSATAQKADPKFEDLKERSKVFLNREPTSQTGKDWEALIGDLQVYTQAKSKSVPELAARSAFNIGLLTEQLAGAKLAISPEYSKRVLMSYEAVAKDFHNSQIADDALLRAAEYETRNGNLDAAAELKNRILREFPKSDTAFRLNKESRGSVPTDSDALDSSGSHNKSLVILDPGHGGEDFGAEGADGLLEKDVTLLIAIETKNALEAAGIDVILTRNRDQFLSLKERVKIANESGGSIFVSIHCNASPKGNVHGFESYYFGTIVDPVGSRIAQFENKSAEVTTKSESAEILDTMFGEVKHQESKTLAEQLGKFALNSLKAKIPTFQIRGAKQSPLYVLESTQMPAALVELGYLDNPEEGARFLERTDRKLYAVALANAIENFLKK